ncbi:MAG TPA: hypothetical protein VM370_09405 [Candidatus Thermoplasmatota archaeon]|nr:hypothetical protein [Candidatus Thermoplasmatota archaeon]
MLNERFLARLRDEFPTFYARVDGEARDEAARLRIETQGDVAKALVRARLTGAGRIWWPYVKGTIPVVRRERDAMEAFSRLVLIVDHVVGYDPGSMDAARDHVVAVLRDSLDVERLRDIVARKEKEERVAAAGAAGLMASVAALVSPFKLLGQARRVSRWLPGWGKVAAGAVVVGALASVPLVAGMSAGHNAEKAARSHGDRT